MKVSVRWVTPGREGEPGVIGELEVAGAGTAADDPALLEGDDSGRVGGVAFGEGPAGMRDRVKHPGGLGVQRRGRVAEPVQRGALAIAQVPVAGP